MGKHEVRKIVREGYGKVAKEKTNCCSSGCGCSVEDGSTHGSFYSEEDRGSAPKDANLGLGCGNPVGIASLSQGETVLDLGSGGGFDCFLASRRVGKEGKVIGVDMTPEMLEIARQNALKGGYTNVEFRLGEIENLPVADLAVDAVISNCVINLSPEKDRVFREAYRVLKHGGRLIVSDIMLEGNLPPSIRSSSSAYIACIGGALTKEEYLSKIESAGFKDIEIVSENEINVDGIPEDQLGVTADRGDSAGKTRPQALSVTIRAFK
uniref:Arsenite methyltransferase n=1 Tax=Candidatus Methanomethylicus mesodigestus TaxID=1867258 RepID=A0A7C3IY40_9CREN